MLSPQTDAQLLASNLRFLLEYLAEETTQIKGPRKAENPSHDQSSGSPMSAVAQERGGER